MRLQTPSFTMSDILPFSGLIICLLIMVGAIIHSVYQVVSFSNDYTERSQALNTTSLIQLTTQLQLQSVSFNDNELCLESERHFSDELGLITCRAVF